MSRCRAFVGGVAGIALALGAGLGSTAGAGTSAQKSKPLRILVSNDDGVAAPGIDALVEALSDLPRVQVTVVAPAENETATGGSTTPGPLTATETTTASGYPATAVQGFPADSVNYGLEEVVSKPPQLVIAGINEGQNLGAIIDVSGTVGAAKAAASRGIPALAVSQGLGDPPDYPASVKRAIKWVGDHRKQLTKGTAAVEVANLNVPTCPTGKVRGEVEVPVAPTAERAVDTPNCESTAIDPPDDISAFLEGYATLSEIPA
jgi:5'-nucleotidase